MTMYVQRPDNLDMIESKAPTDIASDRPLPKHCRIERNECLSG